MNKIMDKYGKYIASAALVLTAMNANTTCTFMAYQPKLPECAQKLRKSK